MCFNHVSKEKEVGCETCQDTGQLDDGSFCQECCPHYEHDHFICLDCDKELDPGSFIDRAMNECED